MKAYVLHDINDFRFEEVDKPICKEDEVLVKVMAAGICGSDIPRVYRTGTYSYPLIPGHEFAGQVVEVSSPKLQEWQNKRVGVFPLIPCKKCIPCQHQQYEMCQDYSYLGSRRAGGFAEYVAVPEWNLIELPDKVSYQKAAMLEPAAVALHAIRKVKPQKDEVIAVSGLGTIGLLVVMILLKMGCRNILAIGNKDYQKRMIQELTGSNNTLDSVKFYDSKLSDEQKWIMEQTDNRGVDVFFDCVGKSEVVSLGLNVTRPGGRMQLVGNPASDMNFSQKDYWKILRHQLTVLGTWNSSFIHDEEDDWHQVLKYMEEDDFEIEKLISHTYELDTLIDGFEIMRDKIEDYVKVMLHW